jgi:sugar-specific transcriptional regulator TrmB
MKESLQKIGLTETEAEIYLQLLKKGSQTAIGIAKETKIHRRTIYDNLNILANRGLVTHFVEKNVKYFQASSPSVLRKNEEERMSEIDAILPDLDRYYSNQMKDPHVELLRGLDATKTILYDMEKCRGTIYWLGGGFRILDALNFSKERLIKEFSRFKLKIIQPRPKNDLYKKYFANIKFVDAKYSTGVAFFVYGNTVVTGNLINDDFFVIKVNDPSIAQAYRNIFEMVWDAN